MSPVLKTTLRWLLVIPVLAVTCMTAAIGLEFSMLLDRVVLASLSSVGSRTLPTLFLHPLHLLVMFAALTMIALPTALSIGFALRTRPRSVLPWAFSFSVLLLAIYVWFLPVRESSQTVIHWSAASGVLAILGGVIIHLLKKSKEMQLFSSAIAAVALFSPSVIAFASSGKGPPEALKVWTVVLQRKTWEGMNTGSEYAASRQLVFAGNRVLAVFDAGMTGTYDQQNWPISNYRILSLELSTGEKKNELDLTGRWGRMPYIYSTERGLVNVQSIPPKILNADLSSAPVAQLPPITQLAQRAESLKKLERCEYHKGEINEVGFVCTQVKIKNDQGQVTAEEPVVDQVGHYAGASKDGSRFALESNESEGDPSFLLYEHFTIYNGQTAKALAMISITDLPERQSWSAFSGDGKLFAVGNPSSLSLYRIP